MGTCSRPHLIPYHVIAFRHVDSRFPFLREYTSRSAGRWNATGELTDYFCDTPDGAWAEFPRHEQIEDPEDILTIRRALWAVDIGDAPMQIPDLFSYSQLMPRYREA